MNEGVEVHVEVGGAWRRAGLLYGHRRRNTESATFVYDPDYVASPDAYALDPSLPLATGPHQTRNGQKVFGAFADTAPDRWGRTLITRAARRRAEAQDIALRSLTEIDFLLGVRDDLRQGALRFRVGGGPFLADDPDAVPVLAQLPELLELAARADQRSASYEELLRLIRAGSSLGGARPKAHVIGSDGSVAIAKFPSASTDTWNVMAWEKVAHDLARDAGIIVSPSELLRVGDRSVHVINRFDRQGDRRLGYVSAMTMLEANDGDARSYLDIAAVIEERSPHATADLEQLWRRIVFAVLISNTDDHLRNHGFLHRGGDSWTLSPAFDLNPNPELGPKNLSCAIDETETAATIENVRRVAGAFRLDGEQAQSVMSEVAEAVIPWRDVATQQGLTRREVHDMAPAFDEAQLAAAAG